MEMLAAYDVAVLGGGPAGSAAARLLATWGRSVVMLARRPARDAMAESLPPSAAKLLDRVGVLGAVDDANFLRSTGNTVHWSGAAPRAEPFPAGTLGWQLRRDVFDHTLLESAGAAGASILADVSVRAVSEPDADGLREITHDGERRQVVRARWVLDCTGRSGILARRGWRTGESAARTLAIVGVWERSPNWDLPDETHTIVESYDAGWAWSIPVTRTQRYVTVMVDPAYTSIGSGPELAATYSGALGRTTAMRELVKQGTLVGAPWAREASPYAFSRAAADGALLVGDAASFVDPLSSFGIKKALASAWLAAVVAHTALNDSATTAHALDLYDAREREMHDELQRQAVRLSRDAAAIHATDFWGDRAGNASGGDRDMTSTATATREAFEEIRRRPFIALQIHGALVYQPKAAVRGNEISVMPHLVTPAVPGGIRFHRNIDVVRLAELAPAFDQVPDLYEAYNRRTEMPAELSDFLAALATLVGIGALRFLDSPPGMS